MEKNLLNTYIPLTAVAAIVISLVAAVFFWGAKSQLIESLSQNQDVISADLKTRPTRDEYNLILNIVTDSSKKIDNLDNKIDALILKNSKPYGR